MWIQVQCGPFCGEIKHTHSQDEKGKDKQGKQDMKVAKMPKGSKGRLLSSDVSYITPGEPTVCGCTARHISGSSGSGGFEGT